MKETKLATICCFMLALLDEAEVKGEEAVHIRKRCQTYIEKHNAYLDLIANEAWDVSCNYEDQPEWSPLCTLISMWSKFEFELKTEAKLNTKYGEKLWNKHNAAFKVKQTSSSIAKYCIEAINKTLYKHKEIFR